MFPGWTVGILFVVVGALSTTTALGVLDRVVRLWPRRIDRADVHALVAASFLTRFVGLLTAAAGISLILAHLLE